MSNNDDGFFKEIDTTDLGSKSPLDPQMYVSSTLVCKVSSTLIGQKIC